MLEKREKWTIFKGDIKSRNWTTEYATGEQMQNLFSLHFNIVVKLQGGDQKRPPEDWEDDGKKIFTCWMSLVSDQDMFHNHFRNRAPNIVWDISHLLHDSSCCHQGNGITALGAKLPDCLTVVQSVTWSLTTLLYFNHIFWEFVLYSIYSIYYRLLFMMDVGFFCPLIHFVSSISLMSIRHSAVYHFYDYHSVSCCYCMFLFDSRLQGWLVTPGTQAILINMLKTFISEPYCISNNGTIKFFLFIWCFLKLLFMLVMLALPLYSSNLNAEPIFSVTFKEHQVQYNQQDSFQT